MALPFSKSQIEKLGDRLVASIPPEPADIEQLHELLVSYDAVLNLCVVKVRTDIGVEATPRLKNTGTILEKLNRHGGSWLKSMQDLAGMRIVSYFNRTAQDELIGQIAELFSDCPRAPKIVDRRREPSNGYRAVHVIVYQDGIPIEIQVRTHWQHAWADLFEKMADKFGRDIRYGEPPEHWRHKIKDESIDENHRQILDELYQASYAVRCSMVGAALAIAKYISVLEEGEAHGGFDEEIETARRVIRQEMADLRKELEGHVPVSEIVDRLQSWLTF